MITIPFEQARIIPARAKQQVGIGVTLDTARWIVKHADNTFILIALRQDGRNAGALLVLRAAWEAVKGDIELLGEG